MKKNEILDQSFDCALNIIELAKFLKNKKEYVISNQIILFDQSESIIKLLTTIIKSTKGKIKN